MGPHFWNTDRVTIRGKGFRYRVGGGWRNFKKPGTSWRKINTAISGDRSVIDLPAQARFGKMSQDPSEILFDSGFSMKRYHDEKNGDHPEPATEVQLQVHTAHNVEGQISATRHLAWIISTDREGG